MCVCVKIWKEKGGAKEVTGGKGCWNKVLLD